MDYTSTWKIIGDSIGSGGQGKVYRVIDSSKFTKINQLPSILQRFHQMGIPARERDVEEFGQAVVAFVDRDDPNNQGALKVLHQPQDDDDFERAKERIKREIEAMTNLSHPNLLRILDRDNESRWFVSQYYSRGTLADNLSLYKGNIVKALDAFRPMVEAVALIHEKSYIHIYIEISNPKIFSLTIH